MLEHFNVFFLWVDTGNETYDICLGFRIYKLCHGQNLLHALSIIELVLFNPAGPLETSMLWPQILALYWMSVHLL